MAGDSILDFGRMAQTAIGIQNLEETRRRNDLYEQNSLLEAQKIDVQKQDLRQKATFRALTELDDIIGSPSLALNLDKQADLLLMKGKIMETGLGVAVPLPDKKELMGGFEQARTAMRAIRSGDLGQSQSAIEDMIIANPKFGRQILDDMKKSGELSTQMQDMDLKLQIHGAQLTKLNAYNSSWTLQRNLLTEHIAGMGGALGIAKDPKFSKQFNEILSYEKPEAREAYLNLRPDFRAAWEKAINPHLIELPLMNMNLKDIVESREKSVRDAQAKSPDGRAPELEAKELSGYALVRQARMREEEWLRDPFNKDKWRAANKAEQSLRIASGEAGRELSAVADQRLALAQTKFDQATQSKLAEALLQETYISGINGGQGDNQALGAAIQKVKEKYPGVPFDATKVVNPEKKGNLNVNLYSPGIQEKLAEERTMVNQIDALIKDFKPQYVGVIDEKLGKLGQMTGTLSKERESWLQRSRGLLTDLRHSRFGASLTENELKAAESELPNETMGDKQWKAAAEAWRDKWGRLIDERVSVAKESRGMQQPARSAPPVLPPGLIDIPALKQGLMQDYR